MVVSVDMISTGTDIRPVECLLFMRNVKSRVYFEQMKGRGTRIISSTDIQAVTPDGVGRQVMMRITRIAGAVVLTWCAGLVAVAGEPAAETVPALDMYSFWRMFLVLRPVVVAEKAGATGRLDGGSASLHGRGFHGGLVRIRGCLGSHRLSCLHSVGGLAGRVPGIGDPISDRAEEVVGSYLSGFHLALHGGVLLWDFHRRSSQREAGAWDHRGWAGAG